MLLTRSILLLLLFLLIHAIAFGQKNPLLIDSFVEDEKFGFANLKGDTVFPAQFDDVEIARFDSTYYFIVRKEHSVGLISEVGEIVIPIKHQRIEPSYNESFIVYIVDDENGVYGYRVASKEGKWISDIYDGVYYWDSYNKYVIVEKDGLLGVLSDSYVEILLGDYEGIEFRRAWENNCYHGYTFDYFEVYTKEGKGIVDSKGTVVLEPIYTEIIPRLRNPQCGLAEVIFEVSKAGSKWGVLDAQSSPIVPIMYDEINVLFPNVNGIDCGYRNRNCETEVRGFCLAEEGGRKVVYNLVSRKKSKPFEQLSAFGEFILFQDDSTTGVLNANFDVIYQMDSFELSPYQGRWSLDFPTTKLYLPFTEEQLGQDCPSPYPDNTVLFPCDQSLYYREPGSDEIGLLNFESGLSIPNVYDSILIRKLPNTSYYWAFRTFAISTENQLDIYDEEMLLIRQLKIPLHQPDLTNEHSYQGSENSMIHLIHGFEGKIGAINHLGDTLIPFEFSDFYYGRERSKDTVPSLCYFAKDGHWGLFNTKGDRLIPCTYLSIELKWYPFAYFQCERSDGFFDIYNNDFQMIAENCQAQFTQNKPNKYGYSEPITSRGYNSEELKQRTLFMIKNGKLFMYENIEWKLMDASYFTFKQDTLTLFRECKIDMKGNVLNLEDYELGLYFKVRKE